MNHSCADPVPSIFRLCVALALMLPAVPVQAQASRNGAPAEEFVIDAWTMKDGLPQSTVTSITQTPDGYLWLGTLGGLVRFDGVRFTVFDRTTTDGLEGNRIQELYTDREGRLWIGTEGNGLSLFHDGRFTTFQEAHGLRAATILAVTQDREGRIWVGTDGGGVARFDGAGFTTFTTRDGLPGNTVRALHGDRAGRVWIATEGGGLTVFEKGRFAGFTGEVPGRTVLAFTEDREGRLWIGTEGGGIIRLTGRELRAVGREDGLPEGVSGYVRAMATDREGGLWIGTLGGVVHYLQGSFDLYTMREGLPRENVGSLFVDREGSLWIGTDRGLGRMKRATFELYTPEDGLADDVALAVLQDRSGTMWIGTNCRGLSRLQDGSFTTLDARDGLSNPCVWSLYEDRTGALWIGTQGGLNRLEDGRITVFTSADGLAGDFVRAITEDHEGALWIGTQGGLSRLKDGRFTSYTTANGLVSNRVRAILSDRAGALWIASAGGLSRLQNGAFQHYTAANGFPSDDVRSLYEDADGVLWIGTYDVGLVRFENGRLTAYTTEDGLHENRVSVILEDARGDLWLGGNRGVQRLAKDALSAFAEGRTQALSAVLYNDGLSHPESSGGFQPAGWKARDGRLWFPTVEGVAVLDPRMLARNPAPPPVVIERVLADGDVVPIADRVAPPRGHRNLELHYTSPSLFSPERTRFRFKLEGLDEEWAEAGDRRIAYYRGLPPGTYTFRAMASNDGITWNDRAPGLSVYIAPYFYESRWFWTLLGLLAVGGAFVAHRLYVRRLRTLAAGLERMVEERVKDLRTEVNNTETALVEARRQRQFSEAVLKTVEEQSIHLLRMHNLKNRFFANISHEFRTPLTLIFDPLEAALNGELGPLDESVRRRFQAGIRNANRLLQLINQLLDLAKLEAGSMELRATRADLLPFVRRIVQDFHAEAERLQVALLFVPTDERLELYFDPDKLEKVVVNLIANALKATSRGGKIRVSVYADSDGGEGGVAVIRVEDTGIGIPADRLPYIFDRFYQVENTVGSLLSGTGIGLSLVKELVELHHGSTEVESALGFGSTFTVRLPMGRAHLAEHQIAGAGRPAAAPPPAAHRGDGHTVGVETKDAEAEPEAEPGVREDPSLPLVLVAEDHPDVRELIRSQLSKACRVVVASNGAQGLQLARELRPDLIVSDVVMPEMDGLELCRRIKADDQLRDIPVMLLTAQSSDENRLKGLETGADEYLAKPFQPRELLMRADNLIRSRRMLRDRFREEVVLQPGGLVVRSAEAAFLQRVHAAVEARLGDPEYRIADLASEVGLSQAQLKRKMRSLTGESPVEFVRNRRLERAEQLLAQQAASVSEIAFAVGFNNLSYFAKCFRERFGTVPSEHRARSTRPPEGVGAS